MARLRTGYAGRDARGRLVAPVTVDLGPAAAHVSGLAAIGRLSVSRVSEYLQADTAQAAGAGPVERRRATPDELARLAPPTPRPASRSAQDGRDGSSAALSTPAPARTPVPATSRKEEPVTATPATPSAGITLPCSTCLHEPVCALKREIPANPNVLAEPMVMGPGLRLVTTGVRIECDHQLVSLRPVAPEPIRAEYGGESWRSDPPVEAAEPERIVRHASKKGERAEKAARARRVLDAIERHGGDRTAAAAELGMRANALAMVAKHADRVLAEAAS